MKARKNPTNEQLLRRLRRRPESERDPRYKNDAYWALRLQGHPHAYAKRAFRDQPPVFHEREVSADAGGCDPEDLLFQAGSTWTELEVAIRPLLSDETVHALQPRDREYMAWDQEVPGLGVRVRTTGYKSFVLFIRPGHTGRLQKHTLGKITALSLDDARQAARARRNAALDEAESQTD
ncbi:integrase arm-type DNA-binding domain-containing protein [Sphingobium rhizovicinum]|uniref:Integrase arm-type DNA-binding domain-containing protein n=1 Tax=Sphingobium rhizovicinum TaxID=432308 RepID=A0ABV7NBH7_9SPHN